MKIVEIENELNYFKKKESIDQKSMPYIKLACLINNKRLLDK